MNPRSILMHICCAPCMIYPFKQLAEEKFLVRGFFYNPNIYPSEEYQLRQQTVDSYARRVHCAVFFSAPDHGAAFQEAIGADTARPERCAHCWYLRLKQTALYARAQEITLFTSTLLVSPYQDHARVREIGQQVSEETGVEFYYQDFRRGYQEAVRISKQEQLYRQKYCGCSFSREERMSSAR